MPAGTSELKIKQIDDYPSLVCNLDDWTALCSSSVTDEVISANGWDSFAPLQGGEYSDGVFTIPLEACADDSSYDKYPKLIYLVNEVGDMLALLIGFASAENHIPILGTSTREIEKILDKDEKYTISLANLFQDVDGDELSYKVKIGNDGDFIMMESDSYTGTFDGVETVLQFKANDGIADSEDIYTVRLRSKNNADKTKLRAEIEKAQKIEKTAYYFEGDRYNGICSSTDGFWNDFQKRLEEAKNVDSKDYEQDWVNRTTAALETAIANLIPKSQLNATNLYEVIQECKENYPDDYLEFFTQATAKNLKAALADAEKYLALLFNEKETKENPNGANRTENVFANQGNADGYAKALNTAQRELVHLDTIAKAEDDASLIQALAKRFSMTENNGKIYGRKLECLYFRKRGSPYLCSRTSADKRFHS